MDFAKKIIKTIESIKKIGKQSIAKLSHQTNNSKSSLHRQIKIINSRSSHVCSEFFQTANGNDWMIRLVLATLFIFGIKFNIGADTLALFFLLLGIEIYVGLSAASINRLEIYIRGLLKKYVNVRANFQLPTIFITKLNPNSISVNLDNPLHITILPGGGSEVRAR